MFRIRVVATVVVASVIPASLVLAVEIALTNPSFEDPVAGKTVGDATWSNIPGWTSTGPSGDSGLEAFSPAPQPDLGTNIAFLQSGDGAIFQTTGHTIEDGDIFSLSFYERNDFEAEELTIRFYYDDGARNFFDTQTVALTDGVGRDGPLTQHFLKASAPGVAAGNLLGIEFENTSAGGSSEWAWVDNVSLARIPEPSALALVTMLGFAGACCRRRFHREGVTSQQS